MNPHSAGYRPDPEQAVPIAPLVDLLAVESPLIQECAGILGAGGTLEQTVPGYQVRSGQLALARTWCRALELRRTAVIQAGTGTGKSLGYLAPSILWALRQNPPATVLVSTATKLLQRQLMQDLATLQRVIPELTFAKMEGRRNYLCPAKLEEADPGLEFAESFEELRDWAAASETGELGELKFDIHQERYGPLKRLVTVQDDECPGARRCPHGADCPFFTARQNAVGVTVVVVNHALLCLHLRRGGLLPDCAAVVVDEAHQLEQYARGAQEGQLGTNRFARLVKAVRKAELPVDKLRGELTKFQGYLDQVRGLHERTPWCFDKGTWQQMACDLTILDELKELEAKAGFQADGSEGYIHWKSLHAQEQLQDFQRDIARMFLTAESDTTGVAWAEKKPNAKHVTARVMPTDVSPWLKENLFKSRPVLLTSATLTTTRDERAWDYSKRTLGWSSSLVLPVESPFAWRKQLLYYVPDDLPRDLHERGRNGKPKYTALEKAELYFPIYHRVLAATKGRAFLLFTSYEMLDAVWEAQRNYQLYNNYDLMRQGTWSKEQTVAAFRECERPVLLATKTFWEGVDIPGSQLSCVMVDAIPFESPTDPLEQALSAHLTTPEKLNERAIPQATLHLKQAFGRLIRRTTDRGLAVPMDPRFRFAAYGPRMLGSLPAAPTLQTTVSAEQLPAAGAWLESAVSQ